MWAAFLRLLSYDVFFFRSNTVTRNNLKKETKKIVSVNTKHLSVRSSYQHLESISLNAASEMQC